MSDSREKWKETPLLKRLRSFEYLALDHICCEAADEIERLQRQSLDDADYAERLRAALANAKYALKCVRSDYADDSCWQAKLIDEALQEVSDE